jgi:hypothetical protein
MKTQLAELIEAYAAARASGSRLLLEFAVTQLNDFIAKVEITETKTSE